MLAENVRLSRLVLASPRTLPDDRLQDGYHYLWWSALGEQSRATVVTPLCESTTDRRLSAFRAEMVRRGLPL